MTMSCRVRAALAVVSSLAVATMLAGCASRATGSGALGVAAGPAASATSAPTAAPTITVATPSTFGPTGASTTGQPPVTTTTTTKPPKPSTKPSKPPIITPVEDYAANLGSPKTYCFWEVTSTGTLVIGALFVITEPAGTGPNAIPITITDNLGDSRSVPSQPINANFPATIGDQPADSGNAFLSRTVDVTVTVEPQGGDDNATDDAASVGVQVPDASKIPAAPDAPAIIPCIG